MGTNRESQRELARMPVRENDDRESIAIAEALRSEFDESNPWCRGNRWRLLLE